MTAPFVTPFLLCSEGPNTHEVPATHAVEYLVADGSFDDITRLWLYTCDQVACLSSAEAHAETVGIHVDTVPLTRALVEDATGWDLSGWVMGEVA